VITISTERLLRVWTELEDALRGQNSYGGHTAEIYGHTLSDRPPSFYALQMRQDLPEAGVLRDEFDIATESAKMNLFMICCIFRDIRKCRLEIEGMSLDDFRNSDFVLGHRAHVRVTRNDKPKQRLERGEYFVPCMKCGALIPRDMERCPECYRVTGWPQDPEKHGRTNP